ncbi:MAG: response regulator SirA [FCB group bacterium]|nr:response regulator SirA [FCB group bacterium]
MKANKIDRIVKRDGRVVPFDQDKITEAIYRAAASVGGHDRPLSENLSTQVVTMLNECFQPPDIPLVEEIQDMVERVLIENGHVRTAKAFILYRDYRRREREATRSGKRSRLPYKMMYETLVWNLFHECDTVEKLNQIIRSGKFKDLIAAADKAFDDSIDRVARAIRREKDRIRLIIVAGPSSSGKTTTTAKLAQRLNQLGIDTFPLNLDHYFFDLEMHPKDEHGDYDFEAPEALDITLIDQHLRALVEGKTIKMPYYDFKQGKRFDNITEITVRDNQVLLIDSLHGLYEPMTRSIDSKKKFKVYIETISQLRDKNNKFIRWTDIRLLRRMVRDQSQRGYDPVRTIGHWHYVRRSEMKHIIPFIGNADYLLNGALPYELPILKKYAFHFFPDFLKLWKEDPKRSDAYLRAKRIYGLLSEIEQFDDESVIPADSLLREFIGGSKYKLH